MREVVRYAVGCDSTVDKLREIARAEGAKAEREACAKIVVDRTALTEGTEAKSLGIEIAAAIRARK